MNKKELKTLLEKLIATWENEVVEFKEAGDNYSISDIGKYFSALSNEANLRNIEKAWLVFGVNDKTRQITNTNYRNDPNQLQQLKNQIANGTEPNIGFRNIYEFIENGSRVILFEVPPAPQGMPISWNGFYYAREGESIKALSMDKQDEIRKQTLATDWSAQIVSNATIADLDEIAIKKAFSLFALKHSNRFSSEEVASWSKEVFLDRAKVTIDGKITRTAILLLGKPESSVKVSPNPAQITWKLEGQERAYEHFGPPFLLNTTAIYQKIRNIQIRLLPNNELLPYEISKYDQKIVLEGLHNCIAHQDYTRNGRVNVIEKPNKLIFENEGSFFEGVPEDYIFGEKMPRRYRNSFLTEAMVSLNMIDKMGYGIHEMNKGQAKRYFPLLDYDLSTANAVRMVIYGNVVDPAYSKVLMEKTDLSLSDILLLDRVQKKLPLTNESISRLKRIHLIEGRKPNFYVSAIVAEVTDKKAEYIRNRSQDDGYFIKLINDYLQKFGHASRGDIDELLKNKLSEALTENQKIKKISNLLLKMRQSSLICNEGSKSKPVWKLYNKLVKN